MAATLRVLRILEAFAREHDILTPELLMTQLGASRASIYRDLQQLCQAGLVERIDGRRYTLGPRIVELDRRIRRADPLLQAATDLMPTLARATRGTVLLCRLQGHQVMCIHEVSAPGLASSLSYERGRAMPLYRGATSRVILVHLPLKRLRDLVRHDTTALQAFGLPTDADALHAALAPERARGHVVSDGEVDTGRVGIAVPLRDGERVLGSLSVVLNAEHTTPSARTAAIHQLERLARRIEGRLEHLRHVSPSHEPSS